MTDENRRFGLASVFVLVAVLIFVLAGFGVHVGDSTTLRMIAFGLAFGFAAQLVP